MKLILLTLTLTVGIAQLLLADTFIINFDDDKAGSAPANFSTALTGKGKPGQWIVTADSTAPSKPNVLAQMDSDSTNYRFPVCVYENFKATNVEINIRFKPVSGEEDQAAGIVWRYQNADNYYIVRANALEGNVVLYKVQGGKRTDLPLKGLGRTYGKKAEVPSGKWSTLSVRAVGKLFEVSLNGQKLYDTEDETFRGEGKVGLWTKADSVTYFDDLRITKL